MTQISGLELNLDHKMKLLPHRKQCGNFAKGQLVNTVDGIMIHKIAKSNYYYWHRHACPFVRLSARMKQLDSRCKDFHEISIFLCLKKICPEKFEFR
jgi:hypothetical protein